MRKNGLEEARERHEEMLKIIGIHLEQGDTTIHDIQEHDITMLRIQELVDSNHITVDDEGSVCFLPKGEREFLNLIRRHRLAERLMHDVLDLGDEDGSHQVVCKVEHVLTDDVTDSICTLLGHPTICPHGHRIPKGRCCELKNVSIKPFIVPLNKLEVGAEGAIAFMSRLDHANLVLVVPHFLHKVSEYFPLAFS